MKKKLLTLLLTLCAAFAIIGFVGCDKDKSNAPQGSTESTLPPSGEESTPPQGGDSSSGKDSSSEQPPKTQHTHNYTKKATTPTCTEQGYTTYTCACGNTYNDDYKNALGHSYTNYLPDSNATYEQDGTKTATCNNGCGSKNIIPDEGTKLKSGISFKTLTVKDDNTVYGKVPNGTATFSFLNEITITGNASYTVSTDITGLNVIPTKTVPVSTGDNVFYVLETVERNLTLYTVTVRVREIYTVSFNTLEGSAVASQEVEEDSFATLPSTIPTKTGYTFDGWNFNFASTPITGDRTITANAWQANRYTVSFDGNGGSSPNGITVAYNSAYGELPTAERQYYTFLGWSTARTQDTQIQPTDVMSTAQNTTLYAVWTTDVVYSKSQDQTHYEATSLYNTQATEICVFDEYDGLPVTAIADNLFDNGRRIKAIILPNTLTHLTQGMLSDCTDLESLTLPFLGETISDSQNAYLGYLFGATSYGENGDYVPSTLKTISLTGGIAAIEQGAFLDCPELTSITIPDSVTHIYSEAFSHCYNLASITIPDRVTTIAGFAFSSCYSLKSVTIPDSVTFIGISVFSYCSNLTSISVNAGNTAYRSIDGNLYSKDGKTLMQYAIGKTATEFIIPNSVTAIKGSVFFASDNLTHITIPNSVITIDSFAFSACNRLTSITFEDTGTWYYTSSYHYTDGTSISVEDANANATYFTSTYNDYYWYKKEN